MAIDRGPWNALVDDDGSNLVGSVWNKAAIKTVILDPTDAAIGGVWQDVPFSAANFSATAPMVWTVGSAAVLRNRYAVVGKTLFWSFYLSWFSGSNVLSGSPSPEIQMVVPGGFSVPTTQSKLLDTTAGITGVSIGGGLLLNLISGTSVGIKKTAGGNFALTDTPGIITTVTLEVL